MLRPLLLVVALSGKTQIDGSYPGTVEEQTGLWSWARGTGRAWGSGDPAD